MSSKTPVDRLRRSFAVRLSIWFAALFAVGFSAIFGLLYWTLGQQLEARDNLALQLRLEQYAQVYAMSGLNGLAGRVAEDSESPHVRSLFIRLIDRRGETLWVISPPGWIEADARRVTVPDQWGGWT